MDPQDLKNKMDKIIAHFQSELASIRSERAHPSLIENIDINVYEQSMKLKSIASITVSDQQTLTVTAWDAGNITAIDKGLRNANLSLNPRIEGSKLLIVLPPITNERRQEFVNLVKQKSEQAKISIRNARRDANESLKLQNKNGSLSDDDLKEHLKKTQNLTDEYSNLITERLKKKQTSIENL
ncbi:ribosome-recycling factor [Spirochaetota bacterium]|nr:ribosome-recycling factor [Spirochaetota bacterium]